jgi:hypothetical protein
MEPQTKTARRKIGEAQSVGSVFVACVPDALDPGWCWYLWGESANAVQAEAELTRTGQRAKVDAHARQGVKRRNIDKRRRDRQ